MNNKEILEEFAKGALAGKKDWLREEMCLALEFLSQKGRPPTIEEWGVFRTDSKFKRSNDSL